MAKKCRLDPFGTAQSLCVSNGHFVKPSGNMRISEVAVSRWQHTVHTEQ